MKKPLSLRLLAAGLCGLSPQLLLEKYQHPHRPKHSRCSPRELAEGVESPHFAVASSPPFFSSTSVFGSPPLLVPLLLFVLPPLFALPPTIWPLFVLLPLFALLLSFALVPSFALLPLFALRRHSDPEPVEGEEPQYFARSGKNRTVAGIFLTALFLLANLFATQPLAAQSNPLTGPQQLVFTGLLGSSNSQLYAQFNAVQSDASGNLYLLLDQKDGVRLLKTDPTATNILAQTQLGAAGDIGLAMALDPSGNVYITGTTTSGTLQSTAGTAFPSPADTSTNSSSASSIRT
jgi:hypothetical protein